MCAYVCVSVCVCMCVCVCVCVCVYLMLARVNNGASNNIYYCINLQVTPLAQLACSNHSVDYGQVDIIGIIITVLSSNITTANGSVIPSNLLVN